MQQIEDQQYVEGFMQRHPDVKTVRCYGIAFCRRWVEIAMKGQGSFCGAAMRRWRIRFSRDVPRNVFTWGVSMLRIRRRVLAIAMRYAKAVLFLQLKDFCFRKPCCFLNK